MSDFNFLDEKKQNNNRLAEEEDHIAMYFKMRQQVRQDSLDSCKSSLSLLSLNNTSFYNEPINPKNSVKLSLDSSEIFKRPNTPPKKLGKRETLIPCSSDRNDVHNLLKAELAKADNILLQARSSRNSSLGVYGESQRPVQYDIFAPSWSPQTPRPFRDSMASITPEATPSATGVPSKESLQNFPFCNEAEVLQLLEKDERKFVANTSGFSHNSDISQFSGRFFDKARPDGDQPGDAATEELSIGEYFGKRSDSISSITRGRDNISNLNGATVESARDVRHGADQNTMSVIYNLLGVEDMSGTALCEELIRKRAPTSEREISIDPLRLRELTLETSKLDINALSQSRQSTPLASRVRVVPGGSDTLNATPMRRGRDWQLGRFLLNASTPLPSQSETNIPEDSKKNWQQLHQTRFDENTNYDIKTNQGDDTLRDLREQQEETVAAGDLTVVSQRIEETPTINAHFKPCKAFSNHSPLLSIVKKLADLPTGTVDCSALTPLIQHEFPELLVKLETDGSSFRQSSLPCFNNHPSTLSPHSGGWVNLSKEPEHVTTCVMTNKLVSVPLISKDLWLLARIASIELISSGQNIHAERRDDSWVAVDDSVTIRAKAVVLPPGIEHCLQLSLVCKKELQSALRITLILEEMLTSRTQQINVTIFLTAVLPYHGFTLSPSPTASFGTLPDNCHEDHTFKLYYYGSCDVPLVVYILEDKNSMRSFSITKNVLLNGVPCKELTWQDGGFRINFLGGKKQTLQIDVRFSPSEIPDLEDRGSVNVEGELRVELLTVESDALPVACTRLHGTVAFAKFLCRADCSPVLFHASVPDVSITKLFHLKNIGKIPLRVALQVTVDPNHTPTFQSPSTDALFSVPKMVVLPLKETVSFEIKFNPQSGENYCRRYLIMNIEPNGKVNYDVELIGMIPGGYERELRSSRSSVKSGSSAVSSRQANAQSIKLKASNSALSWMATGLQKAVLQSFQVKVQAQSSATARVYVSPESDVFKIMNEKGEALSKVRRSFKPDVPVTINVRFKPDSIGLHHSVLTFEFNSSSEPSNVQLTGFGGCPKLRIEDTLLDLLGNRMVKLVHPRGDNFMFTAQFRVTNYGNAPGFVLVTPNSNVLSVAHALKVYPLQSVLEPNTNVIINLSQHLSRLELRDILRNQEIRKLATLNVIMGDEPSRQRLRKYLSVEQSFNVEQTKKLVEVFPGEKVLDLAGIKESKEYEAAFLNSLLTTDVVIVLEKVGGTEDQTVLDLDDTSQTFASLSETILVHQGSSRTAGDCKTRRSPNSSYTSAASQDLTAKKVREWLRKVE